MAVFDTVFHGTIPEYAYKYSVPQEWYTGVCGKKIMGSTVLLTCMFPEGPQKCWIFLTTRFNCITIHLGNGCSIAKVCGGKSLDTSMGFTPLERLGDGHTVGRH